MLFVRGIKGKLKLNPAIKTCVLLFFLVVVIVGGLASGILRFKEKVEACHSAGGMWIGSALPSSYCALDDSEGVDW